VQGCLENSLETAKDEVASGRRVNDESQMVREQIFGQSVAFNTSEPSEPADGPVREGVDQF
jgi:hypothetical protein